MDKEKIEQLCKRLEARAAYQWVKSARACQRNKKGAIGDMERARQQLEDIRILACFLRDVWPGG
jgi:hypothetical protein